MAMASLNKTAENAAGLVLVCDGDGSSLRLETTGETEARAAGSSGLGSPEPSPVVFICAKCKRVLGDSTSWLESDMEDHTVLLKYVSPFVMKDNEPAVSTVPQDHCCTVEGLLCSGCSSRIGKAYRSTPRHLDYKRGLFCLDVTAMESYEIGSTAVQEIAEEAEPVTFELRSEIETELQKTNAVLKLLQDQIAALKSKHS